MSWIGLARCGQVILDQNVRHFQRRVVMNKERRVAVITDASQGIGAGLVRGFLNRRYRVVANSRSIEPSDAADILAVAGDIADPAVADRLIGGAVEKFGRVDTLVNNAGMFIAKPFTVRAARRISGQAIQLRRGVHEVRRR